MHVDDDPDRAGGRRVVLTADGRRLAADARRLLARFERSLGADRAAALRELLTDLPDLA